VVLKKLINTVRENKLIRFGKINIRTDVTTI